MHLIAGIHLFLFVANTGLDESVEWPEYESAWQPIITEKQHGTHVRQQLGG